ncbi:protein tyrosine kinase [Nitzschia inconspicua]|uniref:Protein tyrosine kinase n=1 Tax=Nitzschia inconspicua TaxID=303405 RepID=A0A9K3LP37_9STRA|nr:protein tyrosine kinase [Nitzschia inconspicua]
MSSGSSTSYYCISPQSYNRVFPSTKERLIGRAVLEGSVSSILSSPSDGFPRTGHHPLTAISISSRMSSEQEPLPPSALEHETSSVASDEPMPLKMQSPFSAVVAASVSFLPHTPDTEKLRHALRLVHCIQKERGSSCAYYANNSLFESAMLQARVASDISAKFMKAYTDLPVVSSLGKIRSLIENHKNPQYSSNDLIFHRIFVSFNTLISSVVHECVLKDLSGEQWDGDHTNTSRSDMNAINEMKNVQNNDNYPPTNKSSEPNNRSMDLNADIKDHLVSNPLVTTELSEQQGNLPETSVFSDECGAQDSDGNQDAPIPDHTTGNVSPVAELRDTSPGYQEVRQLLDLLKLFVQLKESAGVERAILSSLLAFRNCSLPDDSDEEEGHGHKSLPSFRMLTNDLILEVENQRALYSKLEKLPSGPHHSLVLELAELSPRLKDLQQIILTDFDSLRGAEFDSENIWDMITMYIDKLHSVELLIIEDLDLARADINSVSKGYRASGSSQARQMKERLPPLSENAVDRALEQISGIGSGIVSHELLADIKRMDPDELKRKVLGLLCGSFPQDNDPSVISGRNASRSVSISGYAESAAAEILKQDMNNALHKPLERAPSKEWDISIYEIKFTKRLGQGASATTYLGKWTGQNVAVKVASITEFGLEGWRTEVNALQRLHHPNIIRLMGSIYNENPQTHCLVLEYCNAGDLASALRYPTPRNFFFHVSSSIANAMSYLHQRGIIHRDLKPSNILCDGSISNGNFVVKITDFGIATDVSRITQCGDNAEGEKGRKLTGETGTYRWMSPEVIRHEYYSTKADVYSFAVMLWQFVTHEEPFVNVSSVEAAKLVAVEKKRMSMPQGIPRPLADLIQQNWDDNPDTRSSFSDIVECLQDLQETLPQDELEWLEEPYGHPVGSAESNEDKDARLQEASEAQLLAGGITRRAENGSSLGKMLKRSSSGIRGKSPNSRGKLPTGKKKSLLSNFFRKHSSFDHSKL